MSLGLAGGLFTNEPLGEPFGLFTNEPLGEPFAYNSDHQLGHHSPSGGLAVSGDISGGRVAGGRNPRMLLNKRQCTPSIYHTTIIWPKQQQH